MVNIEELLMPGERVIKKQRIDVPTGNLYLTNNRLLFLRLGKLWGRDIQIPLQNIKKVWKSFVSLKVQADKEYDFMVNVQHADGWINAIREAHSMLQQVPTSQSQPSTHRRHCNSCGGPLVFISKYNRYYCNNCRKYA